MTTPRPDIHEQVTRRIVEQLEQGVRPWTQPWSAARAAGRVALPRRANGLPYRGVNVLILWMAALAHDYTAPCWLTYRQAGALGGQVRKGAKGTMIVFTSTVTKTDEDAGEDDSPHEREVRFLKTYHVFNAQQIDGLPAAFVASETTPEPVTGPQPIEPVERFFAQLGADIRHGGLEACYDPRTDVVRMPPLASFEDALSYYAVLGHECVHWTAPPQRVGRDLSRYGRDRSERAREELVAELGAAFLAADLGLSLEPREDHAAYIASWLTVLRNDKRAIFTAAAQAQRAVDYLHGLQPTATAPEPPGSTPCAG